MAGGTGTDSDPIVSKTYLIQREYQMGSMLLSALDGDNGKVIGKDFDNGTVELLNLKGYVDDKKSI